MKIAIAGIVAVVTGAGPAVALEGPGRALAASNNLQAASNPVISATDFNQVRRSFVVPYSGTARLKWQIRSSNGTPVTAEAYVPNLSHCFRTTSSTTFVVQACDIRVAAGMVVTVGAFAQDVAETVSLRNVGVYFRIVDSDGKAIAYTLPQR